MEWVRATRFELRTGRYRNWQPRNSFGWFPKISPDGEWIIFGFWETTIANLTTGQEWRIEAPTGARLNPLGFLDNFTAIAATEAGPAAVYSIGLHNMIPVDLGITPELVPMNFGNAANGHWAINATNRPYCIKDGREFRPGGERQYGVYISGDHLCTAARDRNYEIMHFHEEQLIRELPSDNLWRVNEHGDICTGYYGAVKFYPMDGGLQDVTVAPWGRESLGVPVRLDGRTWIWTCTDDNNVGDMFVFGRIAGEPHPIALPKFPAVAVDAVFSHRRGQWVIAGNSDKGHLQVRFVDPNHPRTDLSRLNPVPPPTPQPPTPPLPPTPPAEDKMDQALVDRCIDIILEEGRRTDDTHPELRKRDLEAWQAIVAARAFARDKHIGRKSTTRSSRISPNALGLRPTLTSTICEVAVDYVRDNPGTNEWRGSPGIFPDLKQAWHEPAPFEEPVPDEPGEEPVPVEYHPFVGSATAKFCGECGEARTAAVHQKPEPAPGGGGSFDDTRIIAAINTASEAEIAAINRLRTEVVKAVNEFGSKLPDILGGLGGIFGQKKKTAKKLPAHEK
jgi:hypothetical protein